MAQRLLLMLIFACLTAGCYELSPDAYFPVDYEGTYKRVVSCQQTGHPRGGYQETWVSPEALSSDDIQEGTVILKVQWDTDSNCSAGGEDLTTAMRRTAPGQGHGGGDWDWQAIGSLGDLIESDPASCAGCHAACTGALCSDW